MNPGAAALVNTNDAPADWCPEVVMSFLKKLLGRQDPPVRVRVCVECGMPVEKHTDWCAIYRTQQEMDQKRAGDAAS